MNEFVESILSTTNHEDVIIIFYIDIQILGSFVRQVKTRINKLIYTQTFHFALRINFLNFLFIADFLSSSW